MIFMLMVDMNVIQKLEKGVRFANLIIVILDIILINIKINA